MRGFQYAWPPLAYSIESDAEASRLYSLVTTYFVLATGVVVVAVALLGRWLVRLLAAPEYFGAYRALPWLALGWTLYGLYLVMIVITGRARVTQRNFPAAAAGLAVNVALLLVLVPSGGLSLGLGLAGAGIALCGAYVVMVAVMHLLTRGLFDVGFQWRRLAQLTAILAAVAVSGELLLPTQRARRAWRCASLWLALVPALLLRDALLRPPRARPGQSAHRRRPPPRGGFPRRARRCRGIRRGPLQRSLTARRARHRIVECSMPYELKRGLRRVRPMSAGEMPELSVKPRHALRVAVSAAVARGAAPSIARTRAPRSMAAAGELAYLRAQLTLAARLTARLAATHTVDEMAALVVEELHGTFAFYLAAIQRLDDDGVLRLVAGRGPLAEVMTEFLLVEQSVRQGVNGRVARTGTTALVSDTRADKRLHRARPAHRPALGAERADRRRRVRVGRVEHRGGRADAFSEADAVLVETIAASLGSAIHRAGLVADLERTFTTTLAALMSTVEAKDDYTASHEQEVAELAERVALRMGLVAPRRPATCAMPRCCTTSARSRCRARSCSSPDR